MYRLSLRLNCKRYYMLVPMRDGASTAPAKATAVYVGGSTSGLSIRPGILANHHRPSSDAGERDRGVELCLSPVTEG